jgi:hypothetical protein
VGRSRLHASDRTLFTTADGISSEVPCSGMSALGVGPESIANDHNDYNGVSVEPMFHRPLSSTIVLDRRVNTARA